MNTTIKRALAGIAAAAVSVGCFAFGATSAQAEDATATSTTTITLNGEVAGHTFKAHQIGIFKNVKSDEEITTDITTAEVNTVSGLETLITTTANAAATEAEGVGADKTTTIPARYANNPVAWVSTWNTETDATALRLFVEKLAVSRDLPATTVEATGAAGATSVLLDVNNNAGLYVVTDTNLQGTEQLGTPILVGSTFTAKTTFGGQPLGVATVKPFVGVSAPTLTVAEQSATVVTNGGTPEEGGKLHYTLIGKLPSTEVEAGFVYTFVDVPSTGLTLSPQNLAVYVQATNEDGSLKVDAQGNPVYGETALTARKDYTAPGRQLAGDGATAFSVAIKNVNTLPVGAAIKVTYAGWVNAEPAYDANGIGTVSNTAHIEYGTDADALASTAAVSVEVKVYQGFHFTKISGKDGSALAGAVFTIAPKDATTGFVPTNRSQETSDSNGLVSFSGLAAGTYVVSEFTVPAGYYQEVKPSFEVTINENGTVVFGRDAKWDLVDNSDQSNVTVTNVNNVTQLPSTGGMGIGLIVAAMILAGGATVFFGAKYVKGRRSVRA